MASATEKWATLTPADFVGAMRRRMKSVLLTAMAVTAVVAAVLLLWPNRYISEGMLFVRLGRGSVALDPTTTASTTVSMQESRIAEVASVREMMASRAIAERIVERVGSDEITRPRTRTLAALKNISGWLPSLPGGGGELTEEQYAAAIKREDAIRTVRRNLSVTIPRNAYNVMVEARFGDPVLARDVVQAAMEEYSKYHVEAHSATGSLAFFEQQHQHALEHAHAAQQALRDAKNRMGLLSAPAAEASLQTRISKLEIDRDQTLAELSAAESEVAALNEQLALLSEWVPTEKTKGVANGASDGMRQALYALEIKEREALSTLSPDHPRVRALQEQVAESAEILAQQASERPLTVEALNPIRQNLDAAARAGAGRVAGLQAKRDSIDANLTQARKTLQQLNRDAVELSELTRAAEVAEANYIKHANSLEQARVVGALDRQQLSDVSVIQPAPLILKKIGPPRTLLLLIGGLLGLCLGTLQALLRDGGSQTQERLSVAEMPQSGRTPARTTPPAPHPRRRETDAPQTADEQTYSASLPR
ncbi:GumC family protein [Roseimaritima ulvae]|uniref:Chain length determinant protein n=1 Tax=Roseimaritima ulvae TaxID=980254 RepID=A0A5B9R1M9_9BACT|nr:hypothetical protein [Roseimaritima ulvae]QEG40233.1 hypothetical protein UC8_22400 [Roseimaritima ulvae]